MLGTAGDPTYPLFPLFSFLACLVALVPFKWHWRASNTGICAYMLWTSAACLNGFVNSIVWHGKTHNPTPVWCDISSKLILGASIAIPACALCISRRLYLPPAHESTTSNMEKREVLVDLGIVLLVPVIAMIFHCAVQGNRFDIIEDVGCFPAVHNTLPAYFLVLLWPLILASFTLVYSSLALRAFWVCQIQFGQFAPSLAHIDRSMRLLALSFLSATCTVPLWAYSIYTGINDFAFSPWFSWESAQSHLSRVDLIPSLIWRRNRHDEIAIEISRWMPVACSFIFFGMFGFTREARKHYTCAIVALASARPLKKLGLQRLGGLTPSSTPGLGWKPVQNPNPLGQPLNSRKRRFDSFSFGMSSTTSTTVDDIPDNTVHSTPSHPSLDSNFLDSPTSKTFSAPRSNIVRTRTFPSSPTRKSQIAKGPKSLSLSHSASMPTSMRVQPAEAPALGLAIDHPTWPAAIYLPSPSAHPRSQVSKRSGVANESSLDTDLELGFYPLSPPPYHRRLNRVRSTGSDFHAASAAVNNTTTSHAPGVGRELPTVADADLPSWPSPISLPPP